jgi:hypothetical protein
MQAHEHAMAAAIMSHENNLTALYSAANGDADDTPATELEALGVDTEDTEESARDALDSYALGASTSTVLTVTLAVGGPTQYLSATVERGEHGGWERTTNVTFFDSWAVPNETVLADDSPLVTFFDNEHVELLGD